MNDINALPVPSIKPGVSVRNLQPPMVLAWTIALYIYAAHDEGVYRLTSGCDGKHSRNSLHYVGLAIDLGLPQLASPLQVRNDIAAALGAEYDVVLEPTHIHIEYQPEGPINA